MLNIIYLNGQYLDRAEACVRPADLSILRGYGVFDYFRYADGRPRFLPDHLRRFAASAAGLGLQPPLEEEAMTEVVHQLIDRNGGGDGGIRFVLTGGYAPDGYTPVTPNLLGLPYPFEGPPATLYRSGCRIMLHRYERQLPRIKTIDYIEGIRIQPQLRACGAHYPLYIDGSNHIRESDRSNFMIVRGGTLVTPVDDILLGITRQHLLRVARQLGIPTEERAVTLPEFLRSDEAIICSSVKGALAITSTQHGPVGGGEPGPVTRQLSAAWREYVA